MENNKISDTLKSLTEQFGTLTHSGKTYICVDEQSYTLCTDFPSPFCLSGNAILRGDPIDSNGLTYLYEYVMSEDHQTLLQPELIKYNFYDLNEQTVVKCRNCSSILIPSYTLIQLNSCVKRWGILEYNGSKYICVKPPYLDNILMDDQKWHLVVLCHFIKEFSTYENDPVDLYVAKWQNPDKALKKDDSDFNTFGAPDSFSISTSRFFNLADFVEEEIYPHEPSLSNY